MTKKYIIQLFLPVLALFLMSCEQILMEEDISQKELKVLAPAAGAVVDASVISFHWSAVRGASDYRLQIATPSFQEPQQVTVDTIVEENFFLVELPKKNYEWRVRALNSEYQTSFVSASFKVVINEDFSSNRVVLVSPKEDYNTNQLKNFLEWQEVKDASVYRVQIIENGKIIKEETVSEEHLQISFSTGDFLWKVRAENETQNTFFSQRKITIDTTSPEVPELLRPANESVLATEKVSFEWDRKESGGSKVKDSLFIFNDTALEDLVEKAQVNTGYDTTLPKEETYFWYMESFDEAGNRSGISETFSFTLN